MTTLDQDFEKAMNAAASQPDDTEIYLYYPPDVRTMKEKHNFKSMFRDWAIAVRSKPGHNIVDLARAISVLRPQTFDGSNFGDVVNIMVGNISLGPIIRKRVTDAHKTGSFIRFFIRSPSGNKIWLKA